MAIRAVQKALDDYLASLDAEKDYIQTYLSPPDTYTRRIISRFISLRPPEERIKAAFREFSENQNKALKDYDKALPRVFGRMKIPFVARQKALTFLALAVGRAREKYFSAEAKKASDAAKKAADTILQAQKAAATATALIDNKPPKPQPPSQKSIIGTAKGTVKSTVKENVTFSRVAAGSVLTSVVSNAFECDASSSIPALANIIYDLTWGVGKVAALGVKAGLKVVTFGLEKGKGLIGGALKVGGLASQATGYVASKGTEFVLGGPTYLSKAISGLGDEASRMANYAADNSLGPLSGIEAKGDLLSDTVNYLVDSPVIHTALAATVIARPLSNKAYEKGYQKTGHAIRAAGAAVTAIPVYEAVQNGSAREAWNAVTGVFGMTNSEPVAQTGLFEGIKNAVKDSWTSEPAAEAGSQTSMWTLVTEGVTEGIKSINDFGSKTLGPSLKTAWDASVGPTLEAAQGPAINGAKEALGPTCIGAIETVASYATPLINTVANNPLPIAAAVAVAGVIAYKTGLLGKLAGFAVSGVRAAIDRPKSILLPALAAGVAVASPAIVVGAAFGLAYNLGGRTVAAPAEAATPTE